MGIQQDQERKYAIRGERENIFQRGNGKGQSGFVIRPAEGFAEAGQECEQVNDAREDDGV